MKIGGIGNKDAKKITFTDAENMAFTYIKTGSTGKKSRYKEDHSNK